MKINIKRRQFINFSLVWLAYCSTYFIRKPLGVVKGVLGMELGLNMSELGWLDVAAILPYAVVQIGFPGLSSKYGGQITLRMCLVGAAVSSVFSSLVSSFSTLVLSLLFTGVFLAPCWPASSLLLSTWFPSSKHNFVFGLINTATYSGGLGGTALATALLQYSGWRSVFLAPALLAILVSIFLLCILPIHSENIVRVSASGEKLSSSLGSNSNQPSLVKIPAVRELCICIFCLKFVRYFMYMWLPLYLVQHLEYSALQAGFMSTLFDIGGIFGSPLLGILLDKWFSNAPMKPVSIVMMSGVSSLALFIITSTWGRFFNGVCLLIAGAANCGPDSIVAGSISMEIGDREGKGRGAAVTSLVNGVGHFGSMIEGPLVGLVWGVLGWNGVMMLALFTTLLGTLAAIRAHHIDKSERSSLPFIS